MLQDRHGFIPVLRAGASEQVGEESLINCHRNEHTFEAVAEPCREEVEVRFRYCRGGKMPKDLGEPSSSLIVLARLSVRFTPLRNGSDDLHYLVCECKVVCCPSLLCDLDEIVERTPIRNAHISLFGSGFRPWVALRCKKACIPQRLEKPEEVGTFEKEREPMPCEFLAFLHLVDEGPLVGGKDRHGKRFSISCISCCTKGFDAGMPSANASITSSSCSQSFSSRRNGTSSIPHSFR